MAGFNWDHKNPEIIMARNEEAQVPFSERGRELRASFIEQLIQDAALIDSIRDRGYPTDEETCDDIGKRHGLGPEQVAKVSKRLRESDQEKKGVH